MRLLAAVAAIEQAFAVRSQFRPRAPCGFLAEHSPGLRGVMHRHGENIAGAPGDFRIADEVDDFAIRRPRRVHRVIERGIVVAIDRALALAQKQAGVVQAFRVDIGDEQVEMPGALRGYPDQALAVRRYSRLDVDAAVAGQGLRSLAFRIETPEFHRLAVVADENGAAAVGRDVGLVIVGAARMRHLVGGVLVDALPPQRAGHRINQRLPVGEEIGRGRTGGELRQIELAPVVAMREIDLLEHRLATGRHDSARTRRGQQQ